MKRKEIGRLGEELTAQHLEQLGYKIIKRNLRLKCGEIDIICQDSSGSHVLVEVKTVNEKSCIQAVENITKRKIIRLKMLSAELTSILGIETGYIMFVTVKIKHSGPTEIEMFILDG